MARLCLLLALAALASAALTPAPAAAAPTRATVGVFDNFFKPRPITIRRGGVVTWRWRGSRTHNVALLKPRRSRVVKRSAYKRSGRFRQRLRALGRWRAICEIHPRMRMVVRVTRR